MRSLANTWGRRSSKLCDVGSAAEPLKLMLIVYLDVDFVCITVPPTQCLNERVFYATLSHRSSCSEVFCVPSQPAGELSEDVILTKIL